MPARSSRLHISSSWLKASLLIIGLGASSAALAAFVWARFPLLDVMNGLTIKPEGYEIFNGKVDGIVCHQNTKTTPTSSLVITFDETIHPDWDHVDGKSGASTREKQLDEIYTKFKLGGRFSISQINGLDLGDTPLTGNYSGNAKKLTLQFDDAEALIRHRGVCAGDTEFALQTDAKGKTQFSAVFAISNGKKTGTLTINAKLIDKQHPSQKSTYSAVYKAVSVE